MYSFIPSFSLPAPIFFFIIHFTKSSRDNSLNFSGEAAYLSKSCFSKPAFPTAELAEEPSIGKLIICFLSTAELTDNNLPIPLLSLTLDKLIALVSLGIVNVSSVITLVNVAGL